MRQQLFVAIVLATMAFNLGGCQSTARVAGESPATTVTAFNKLKALEGEWETTDPKGQKTLASIFKVSSNGSALREIMLPGTPYEMTNLYHLDGTTIVATHYCAEGHQPRMRCAGPVAAKGGGTAFPFEFADITNLKSADTRYMADLTLVMVDSNHLRQEWNSRKEGEASERVVFELVRKN